MVHLLQDVLEQILLLVPTKSVIRFQSVSKYWKDVISSPRFALRQSKQAPKQLKILYHTKESINLVDPEEFVDDRFYERKEPLDSEEKVVGSCHGLVCIDSMKGHLIIWNPLTNVHRKIPYMHDRLDPELACSLGFGYSSRINDFKVILLTYVPDHGLLEAKRHGVFSLGKNCWTTIENSIGSNKPLCSAINVVPCVNEALHWLVYSPICHGRVITKTHGIAAFDLRKESFHDVALPNFLILKDLDKYAILAELGGSLCISFAVSNLATVIWVMKKYGDKESWTPVLTVIHYQQARENLFFPLCVSSIAGLIGQFDSALVSYNGKKDKRLRRIYNIWDSVRFSDAAVGYVETLASPSTGFSSHSEVRSLGDCDGQFSM